MIWSVDNNMKLNNKGFTLIELLAVFVILISVSFVAVGGITSSLDNQDERDCENQKDIAISAAKMYFSLGGKNVDQSITGVTIKVLREDGYIKSDYKIDFNDNYKIKLYNNKYVLYDTTGDEFSCN